MATCFTDLPLLTVYHSYQKKKILFFMLRKVSMLHIKRMCIELLWGYRGLWEHGLGIAEAPTKVGCRVLKAIFIIHKFSAVFVIEVHEVLSGIDELEGLPDDD